MALKKKQGEHVPILKLDGLAHFLSIKGHTLLIKGEPGCGKTTLALKIIEEFGDASAIYISSRVSEPKLYSQLSYTDTLLSEGKFVDVRLDTLESIIRRIIEIRGDNREALVVLDTWDGLAKELDEKTRIKTEKTLIALADGSNARFIFVSEEPSRTTIDYLVDGIVELLRTEESGRVVREILVHKLRGTPIEQHRYLFSLVGGKFNHVPPYFEPDYSKSKTPKPRRDPKPETYSFGSILDDVFGGVPHGSTVTLEYGVNVPSSAIHLVTFPLLVNFLNLGRSCIYVPLLGANPKHLVETVRPHISDEALKHRLRVASPPRQGEKLETPFFEPLRKPVLESHADVSKAIETVKANSQDKKTLVVDGLSLLENMFLSDGDRLVEGLADRVIRTQANGDLTVFLAASTSKILQQLLSMSAIHIKLWVKDRSVLMAGEKPITEAYAIWPSENPILPEYIKIV